MVQSESTAGQVPGGCGWVVRPTRRAGRPQGADGVRPPVHLGPSWRSHQSGTQALSLACCCASLTFLLVRPIQGSRTHGPPAPLHLPLRELRHLPVGIGETGRRGEAPPRGAPHSHLGARPARAGSGIAPPTPAGWDGRPPSAGIWSCAFPASVQSRTTPTADVTAPPLPPSPRRWGRAAAWWPCCTTASWPPSAG